MRPFGRWSDAPVRREPGSRQPEQYALDAGIIQISGDGEPAAFLLQSKIAQHGWSDHDGSDVERLASQPGGSRLFSAAAMVRVPYLASIVPHVVRMEPGYAEVMVPKWFLVKTVVV